MNDVESLGIGYGGSRVIKDTDRYAGKWKKITVLSAVTFAEYEDATQTGDITGFAIAAGITLTGNITTVRLTSGTIIAYE